MIYFGRWSRACNINLKPRSQLLVSVIIMKRFRILKTIILSFIPTENGWRPNWRLQRTPTSSERIIWPRTMFDLEKMFKLNSDLLILFERIRELNLEWLTLIEGPANLTEIFSELLTLKFISDLFLDLFCISTW